MTNSINFGSYSDFSVAARLATGEASIHAHAAHLPACMKARRESFLEKFIKKTLEEMRGHRNERATYILAGQ
jgi:hypothetical protein